MDGLTLDRHKVIPTLDWSDLTVEEKSDYGWDTFHEGIYFRYLGTTYSDQEFMYSHDIDWDGYLSDTFFSGVFIKFEEDFETVHCMRYFS